MPGHNLLIEHLSRYRLFLVLDNVGDQLTSIEEAKSYLSLLFKDGSVVLVMACTLCILKLVRNVTWKDCFPTPFSDTQPATNLFFNCTGYIAYHSQCSNRRVWQKHLLLLATFDWTGTGLVMSITHWH